MFLLFPSGTIYYLCLVTYVKEQAEYIRAEKKEKRKLAIFGTQRDQEATSQRPLCDELSKA